MKNKSKFKHFTFFYVKDLKEKSINECFPIIDLSFKRQTTHGPTIGLKYYID